MKLIGMKFSRRKIFLLAVFSGLIIPGFGFTADLSTQCETIAESSTGCPNMSASDCKLLLQKCADYYDEQSGLITQDLTKTSQQKNTLQNQIGLLKKKIQGLTADINQGKIMVKDLNIQITDTQESISKTSADIQDSQNQICTHLPPKHHTILFFFEDDFVYVLQSSLHPMDNLKDD